MKPLSLFFIVFVCASIVVWNWEKTPHLTILLPPHDQALHLFPVKREHAEDEAEQGLGLVPPSPSTITNSNYFPFQDEYPKASHMVHFLKLYNTTPRVKKSISEGKERADTVKQQLITLVTSQRTESTVTDTPMTTVETQAFNFGKGKSVPAENRPLYSGFGCKQWLFGMWASRLTQRTYFGYEKLKW
ncbi:hypothetical protein R6Q59_009353 [Mikania micrantha]